MFIGMLPVFYMDAAKVDRDVAKGCTCMLQLLFPIFHLFFFRRMLQVCLFECCICFHTYVVSVLSGCCVCLQWFQVFFRCFCKCFKRMFQVFHLS
jgi:hypothetical protein